MAKRIIFVILLLGGLGAAVWVMLSVGLEKSFERVAQAGLLGVSIYVANCSLTYVVPAFSWWMLLRAEKVPVTLLGCLQGFLMGFPIGLLMPSMYLGGEPVKAYFVTSHFQVPGSKVAGTMMVTKFQESVGLLLFMVISIGGVLLAGKQTVSDPLLICVTVGTLVVLLIMAMVAYAKGYKPVSRFVASLKLVRLAPEKRERLRKVIEEFEESAHRSIYMHWKVFIMAQVICLIAPISLLVRPWLFIIFYPEYAGTISWSFVFGMYLAINLVNLIQFTPGGFGTFEAAMWFVFDQAGYLKEDAGAFNVMNRIYDAVLGLIGIVLLTRYGLLSYMRIKKQ